MRPDAASAIRVVEPQMQGFAHAPFNAAFLHTACLAYPDRRISFSAIPSHLAVVREILEHHAPDIDRNVAWEPLTQPPGGGQRAWWRWSADTLRAALRHREPILFPSLSRMQLFQAKWLVRRTTGAKVCVVLHGDLEELLNPRPDRFPLSMMSLPKVAQSPTPDGFRYLLLSRSIFDNVPRKFAQLTRNAGIIEHPYHFSEEPTPPSTRPVFGVFGNTGDGRDLETVARTVKAQRPEARIRIVGFLKDQEAVDRLAPLVEGATHSPLSRTEFVERAQGVTHALWLAKPDGFRLRASGTFFDALAFAAPLVYTQNAYLDPYHGEAPEIGWRCRDLHEAAQTVVSIVDAFDPVAHAARRDAILRFRRRFSPEGQAPNLRAATALDEA